MSFRALCPESIHPRAPEVHAGFTSAQSCRKPRTRRPLDPGDKPGDDTGRGAAPMTEPLLAVRGAICHSGPCARNPSIRGRPRLGGDLRPVLTLVSLAL